MLGKWLIFSVFLPSIMGEQLMENNGKLHFVQAIWRHGDRAPKRRPYETDIYDEKYWPRGWNQLTNLGMRQMKELGQFLHSRYVGHFLSSNFDRKEVHIRSSNEDRALESALALLSGMYPPLDPFEKELSWQPIPVHSAGEKQPDPLLRPTKVHCPRYEQLKKTTGEQLEERLMPRYRELANFLRPILNNVPEDQPIPLKAITGLKSIQMEMFHNLSQPDWVTKNWPQYGNRSTIELIAELRSEERVAEFGETEGLARLAGGYLLGDWLAKLKALRNSSLEIKPARKAILYSAHDGTILALLAAMGKAVQGKDLLKMPPFASCLVMEVYQQGPGEHFVELFYRRNQQMEKLHLEGCANPASCRLNEFIKTTGKNAIFEEEKLFKECGVEPRFCENVGIAPTIITQLMGVLSILSLSGIIQFYLC